MNKAKYITAVTDWLIILLFSAFIFGPFFLSIPQSDRTYSETEKRPLAKFPSLTFGQKSFTDVARDMDTYYQDHFGLREFFIHRYHREMKKRFHVVAISDVLEGKDGWLFYAGDVTLKDLKGNMYMSPEELERLSLRNETYRRWLEKKGIYYLQVVTPNKQSIYPEYLPDYYQKMKKESRLDQVLTFLHERKSAPMLDMRPVIIAKKGGTILYHKNDTHWNTLGAFYAYNAIIGEIQKSFPDLEFPKDIKIGDRWEKGHTGDLSQLAGSTDPLRDLSVVSGKSWETEEVDPEIRKILSLDQTLLSSTRKKGGKLRVMILHDSFMLPLVPFMSESFGEVLYIWKYLNDETTNSARRKILDKLIDYYKPDIVIDEIIERNLNYLIEEDFSM